MTYAAPELRLREIAAEELRPWLPSLTDWLLPGSFYNVEHTWPQLYRSDGDGRFLAVFFGGRLVSHLAFRVATMIGERSPLRASLVGSVVTDPEFRGRRLATQLLRTAREIAENQRVDTMLLWAERPELYRDLGYADTGHQWQAVIHRGPSADGIRPATHEDREALRQLHEQKPIRTSRTGPVMERLLSVPGMWTTVLERDGQIRAYACCGKGADLQGWWHEVGGEDADVAALLQGSLHLLDQPVAMLMLPDYRTAVLDLLGVAEADRERVSMAMALPLTDAGKQELFVDGLDSV